MERRLKNIQTFEQHSSELNISDVRQRFIDLLGEDKVRFIEKNNRVEFIENHLIYMKQMKLKFNFLQQITKVMM
jgi:hypothetical protein